MDEYVQPIYRSRQVETIRPGSRVQPPPEATGPDQERTTSGYNDTLERQSKGVCGTAYDSKGKYIKLTFDGKRI